MTSNPPPSDSDRARGPRWDDYTHRPGETESGDRRERTVPLEVQLRKFHRDSQQNGILSEIKRRRFSEKPLSRQKKRESAIRKAERRHKRYGY